jgi:hypothetical protein
MRPLHAFTLVLFAVLVPVLVNFATVIWSKSKIAAAMALVVAIVLQVTLAYYAVGPERLRQLLAGL